MRHTLPQERLKYCPVCGSPDFKYDHLKAFNCGGCGFSFYINSAAAVAAIIENEQGEILLTRRAFEPHKGYLDLPGGFVDPMESIEEALMREIKEELNLEVTEMQYLFSVPNQYVFSNYTVYTTDLAFRCKTSDINAMETQDDVAEALFVKPAEINYDMIGAESIKKILKRYT